MGPIGFFSETSVLNKPTLNNNLVDGRIGFISAEAYDLAKTNIFKEKGTVNLNIRKTS